MPTMGSSITRTEVQRLVATVIVAAALAGCGDQPLQGIGQRSGGWIGPIAEDVRLLPGDGAPSAAP